MLKMVVCNLEKLMKSYDITQVDLSEKLNISRSTISSYCNNKAKSYNIDHLNQFIEFFKCKFDDLFTHMSEEEYNFLQNEKKNMRVHSYYQYEPQTIFSGCGSFSKTLSKDKKISTNPTINSYEPLEARVYELSKEINKLKEQMNNMIKYVEYNNRD